VTTMHTSTSEVEACVENSVKAGESLENIAQLITEINTMNSQIAAATTEQEQVATLMVSHTQDICAKTEDTFNFSNKLRSTSEQLKESSDGISKVAQSFKV